MVEEMSAREYQAVLEAHAKDRQALARSIASELRHDRPSREHQRVPQLKHPAVQKVRELAKRALNESFRDGWTNVSDPDLIAAPRLRRRWSARRRRLWQTSCVSCSQAAAHSARRSLRTPSFRDGRENHQSSMQLLRQRQPYGPARVAFTCPFDADPGSFVLLQAGYLFETDVLLAVTKAFFGGNVPSIREERAR